MATRRTQRQGPSNLRIVIAVGVVVIFAAIVFGSSLMGGDDDDTTIAEADGPTPKITPISSYRVTYRTESMAGGPTIVTTEEITIRRPFESLNRSWTGEGAKKKFSSEVRTSGTLQSTAYDKDAPFVLSLVPGSPPGDMRLDVVLDDLVRRGVVVPGKEKTVNGRKCVVLKTKDPIIGSVLEAPNSEDHTDNCVDEHGIVVEERWWLSKKLTRVRTLTDLDLAPTVTDADFKVTGTPVDLASGGSSIAPNDKPLAKFLAVDLPSRFKLTSTYQYLVGQPPRNKVPQQPLIRAIDVWTDGNDFIVFEQGQSPQGGGGLPSSMGLVEIPILEQAGVSVTIYGSEVFGNYDAIRLVRLRGSVRPEDLVDIAKTMHTISSTTSTTGAGPSTTAG